MCFGNDGRLLVGRLIGCIQCGSALFKTGKSSRLNQFILIKALFELLSVVKTQQEKGRFRKNASIQYDKCVLRLAN
jgi:hypothetical protein